MAKVQTRRTISFSREFYDRVRTVAADQGVSMSRFVEAEVLAPAYQELAAEIERLRLQWGES